jgi:hypothetical protein
MKKLIALGLIALIFASLLGNCNVSIIQNQNSNLQTQLTHTAEHVYIVDSFNTTGSHYLATTGNATLALLDNRQAGNYTALYSFKQDANATSPPGGWSGDAMVVNSRAGHNKTAMIPNQMYQYFANYVNGTLEMWLWIPDYQGSSEHTLTLLADDSDAGENKSVAIQFRYGGNPPETWDGIWVWNYTVLGGCNTFMADLIHESWFHIQIDFDCHQYVSNYNVTYNGTTYGPYLFEYGYEAIHTSWLKIDAVGAQVSYIDAIDYSWADDYVLNRNMDLDGEYAVLGSYVSSVMDLGEYNNYYLEYINLSYTLPSDSEIAGQAQFSVDNETWSGWLPLGGLPNVTGGFETGRYCQFMVNLTASSDTLDSPELYSILVQFQETILNEIPEISGIAVSFDNETLEATISCIVFDPDADLLNVTLCLPLGTVLQTFLNVANGTEIICDALACNYSTAYSFYFNASDGEDAVQSSLFGFKAGAEPPPETPEVVDYVPLYVLFGIVILGILVIVGKSRPRA